MIHVWVGPTDPITIGDQMGEKIGDTADRLIERSEEQYEDKLIVQLDQNASDLKLVLDELTRSSSTSRSRMLPEGSDPDRSDDRTLNEARLILEVTQRLADETRVRTHYYVKIGVSSFLCALLLSFGIPVFMAARMTGSISYTALGIVLISFGLILAIAVVMMLLKPPFKARSQKDDE